ncbi:hypothetical protein [Ruminococcus flavefaciens]|uniref:Uncharacterized protein n=1 Tax=Ruminococcus flavefaciens 007c TaxID=1341157 RepID=W7UXT9_RUMFL|nr:hypothetical protein [Ruminococcus flavefaciens]EWM53172.1 hypothetical protein RF007C_16295 [Ruminococcus flavefaciens 007c]
MDKYYPFEINSKRILLRMNINAFWKLGDAYFQIHEMPDNSIKAYWRKGLPNIKFAECAGTIARKYFAEKQMSIRELITTDEYKKEIAKISPINEIEFLDKEANQIIDFCNIGLPDDYDKISGRDGHSYDIWIRNGKRINLWCFVHENISYVADVINLLVNKAELDEDMYSIRVQK